MQDRSIPTKVLLTETIRLLPQFVLFVAFLTLIYAVAFSASGSMAIALGTFFALMFFAAPLACAAVRSKRGLRLLTRAGGKTLLFCFTWGGIVAVAFIAILQVSQGMRATSANYFVAMVSAGLICAAMAVIPRGR
jgi:hypothetical protein